MGRSEDSGSVRIEPGYTGLAGVISHSNLQMLQPSNHPEPFLHEVRIKDYKSIGKCNIQLQSVTVLVGRNGAGKSNFLDALSFVKDSLTISLEYAIQTRGGIRSVLRRGAGCFSIGLFFRADEMTYGKYGFEITEMANDEFVVNDERLELLNQKLELIHYFHITSDRYSREIKSSLENLPKPVSERLFLVAASGFEAFRPAYDALCSMGFYSLNPESMKELQPPDSGEILHRDGSNIASVIARLKTNAAPSMRRVEEYLDKIVEDVQGLDRVRLGPKETLLFHQEAKGLEAPRFFYAASMSDGTLRALGTLVAVQQLVGRQDPIRLVGIEEPETALHPAAASTLMDALLEASANTQVIVTTHSADLIDDKNLDPSSIYKVTLFSGQTIITKLNHASLEAIRRHLYSPGELQRMDQFEPDLEDWKRQEQMTFWGLQGK